MGCTHTSTLTVFPLEETCSLFLSLQKNACSVLSVKMRFAEECVCVPQVIREAAVGIREHRLTPRERREASSNTLKCASPAPRDTHSTARPSASASPTPRGRAGSPPANVSQRRRKCCCCLKQS